MPGSFCVPALHAEPLMFILLKDQLLYFQYPNFLLNREKEKDMVREKG